MNDRFFYVFYWLLFSNHCAYKNKKRELTTLLLSFPPYFGDQLIQSKGKVSNTTSEQIQGQCRRHNHFLMPLLTNTLYLELSISASCYVNR